MKTIKTLLGKLWFILFILSLLVGIYVAIAEGFTESKSYMYFLLSLFSFWMYYRKNGKPIKKASKSKK